MSSTSAQSLATAALSYLPRPWAADLAINSGPAIVTFGPINKETGEKIRSSHNNATLVSPSPLPSLLGYVDNTLVRRRAEWNRPPPSHALCRMCTHIYYTKAIPRTTYLPLTCGCWIHYDCFLQHVVGATPNIDPRLGRPNDCCPICRTRLFTLEGIVMLTLATRTKISMADIQYPLHADYYWDVDTSLYVVSDSTAYAADCKIIEKLIVTQFIGLFDNPNSRPSLYLDGSPDLRTCYYDILEDIDSRGYPKSRWLQFNRNGEGRLKGVGFLLFGMLVAVKMRGFLVEHHARITVTEAWADFENCREELQRMILKHVRGGGWSWADKGLPVAP